jgi:hypothetical protein
VWLVWRLRARALLSVLRACTGYSEVQPTVETVRRRFLRYRSPAQTNDEVRCVQRKIGDPGQRLADCGRVRMVIGGDVV